jgi:YVTN family beta-propeller protein
VKLVIDTATNTVTATVNVGVGPYGVAVNPDGTKVYVANLMSNNVSVIDTATNTVTATVNVGVGRPYGVAVNPAGTKVYVANYYFNNVSVIDTLTPTPTSTSIQIPTPKKNVSGFKLIFAIACIFGVVATLLHLGATW